MTKIILPDFSGLRIAVIGDAMNDVYVHGRIERISPEAPVPVFLQERRERLPGGAANVLENVKALGATVKLIAKPSAHWSTKTRYIVNGQQVFRADVDDLNPCDSTAEIIVETLQEIGCSFVIVSDYAKGMVTEAVMDGVRASGLPFIVDPKGYDWTRYAMATLVTPNQHEWDKVRNHLAGAIDWNVLVTQGERGMTFCSGPHIPLHIPATVHEVADVTGAGDTVIATLGCCLAAGMDLVDAARIANAAAGVVVQKRGTAVCTRQELEAALV